MTSSLPASQTRGRIAKPAAAGPAAAKKQKKRYVCTGFEGCSMEFTRSENLARHKRKHTGEKPFRCHVCLKYFSRIDNLKQHVDSVHGKNLAPEQKQTLLGGVAAAAAAAAAASAAASAGATAMANVAVGHRSSFGSVGRASVSSSAVASPLLPPVLPAADAAAASAAMPVAAVRADLRADLRARTLPLPVLPSAACSQQYFRYDPVTSRQKSLLQPAFDSRSVRRQMAVSAHSYVAP